MTVQLALAPAEQSTDEKFLAWIEQNPHVEAMVVNLAREWAAKRPGEKCGIGMLWETLRWQIAIRTTGDEYRLNNDWRAYLARKIQRDYPDLAGLFETRRSRADRVYGVAA